MVEVSLEEEPPAPPDRFAGGGESRVIEVAPGEGLTVIPEVVGVLNLHQHPQHVAVETRRKEDGGIMVVIVLAPEDCF